MIGVLVPLAIIRGRGKRKDSGLEVRGGRGGTVAVLTDMERAAVQMREVAEDLAEMNAVCIGVSDEVAATARLAPVTAHAVQAAVSDVTSGPMGLRTVSTELCADADDLDSARKEYEDGEENVRSGLHQLGRIVGGLLSNPVTAWGTVNAAGQVATGAFVWDGLVRVGYEARRLATGYDEPPPESVGRAVVSGMVDVVTEPEVVEGLLGGFTSGVLPGNVALPPEISVPLTATIFSWLLRLEPSPDLEVTQRPGVHVTTAAEGAEDLVRRLETTYPDPDEVAGTVRVEQIDHADGERAWTIFVPGTQDWGLGGDNPFDLKSNIRLMAGQVADSTRVVLEAMEQAGIRKDEPVIIIGHSQGGMAAMRAASHASRGGDYNIKGVATLGSPVGTAPPLPDHIDVLHLEHSRDVVPALDGTRNPDTPNRVTVTRDLALSSDPADQAAAGDVIAEHELPAYRRTAALVDQSDDASIVAWKESMAEVLGDGTARSTVREYEGVRIPQASDEPAGQPPPASDEPAEQCQSLSGAPAGPG